MKVIVQVRNAETLMSLPSQMMALVTATMLAGASAFAESNAPSGDALVWAAMTNRWMDGKDGEIRSRFGKLTGKAPIELVNTATNGVLSSVLPRARLYQVTVLLDFDNMLAGRTQTATVVLGGEGITFIESDAEAISFINGITHPNGYSTVRAIQDVLSFGELRGYPLATQETFDAVSPEDASRTSRRSIAVTDGAKDRMIEGIFVTAGSESQIVLWLARFTFSFDRDGRMTLVRKESAGGRGGYL